MLEIIKKYYEFRGLKQPDKFEAMLFLLSEVGELAAARDYYEGYDQDPNSEEYQVIQGFVAMGQYADRVVSDAGGWTRNNDRTKAPNIEDEVGDVFMMLSVFCEAAGIPQPDQCLIDKMKKKGFQAGIVLPPVDPDLECFYP